MAAMHIVQRVAQHYRGIPSALWEALRSSEIERESSHINLCQADGRVDSVINIEIGRVQQPIRLERNMDPVVTQSHRIRERVAEDVILVDGHDLPPRRTGI